MSRPRLAASNPAGPANPLVVALAYDGLSGFEYGCAVELFGAKRPDIGARWYDFAVAGAEPGRVRGAGGVSIIADGGLELLAKAGTIVAPGWRGVEAPPPRALCEALRHAHASGARIVSFGAGCLVLAAAGLLEGRLCAADGPVAAALAARHPAARLANDALFVDDGDVLTAVGGAAALDLGVHIVRRDWGQAAANLVARGLLMPARRRGEPTRAAAPVPASVSALSPLLDRVRRSLDHAWTVEEMAATLDLSPRALHRCFRETIGRPPLAWLICERVLRTRTLLETTSMSIEDIATAAGFVSAAMLRHHFNAQTGAAPRAHRGRAQAGRKDRAA